MTTPAYAFCTIPLTRLHFDPENPRLPPSVDGANSEAVLEWMLADTGLLELMGSIARRGYFPGDPLLVSPCVEANGGPPAFDPGAEYKVVEGNRRLAAVMLLIDPDLAPRRRKSIRALADEADEAALSELPVVLFAHRDDVLDYLGYRHITGVKEWDPLEKARYLRQLRDRARNAGDPHTNTDLARVIGSKGPYVGRLLAGLEALERLSTTQEFQEAGVIIDDVPFSLLSTALNYDNITFNFLKLNSPDDPELTGIDELALVQLGVWLFVRRDNGRTALEDSRNMRLLNEVVRHERAVAALNSGSSIREASLLAHRPEEVLLTALGAARTPLNVANAQADDLEEGDEKLVEASQEILTVAGEVAGKIAAKTAASNGDG